MTFRKNVLLFVLSLLLPGLLIAQNSESNSDTTIKSTSKTPNKPKPYKEVITSKAVTDDGLFKVHKVDNRYYFEIPDSLMDRDILTVNRISKAAAAEKYLGLGYPGDLIGESVIRFSKGPNYKLFLRAISYLEGSKDSSENGMFRSVINSNLQPIAASFDIKAFSSDSTGVVIDMTDFINGETTILFFEQKAQFSVGALQPDKSYINTIHSFPQNIEIQTVKTFSGAFATSINDIRTLELNSSIILLPKVPMKPRYSDQRIGYFTTGYLDYDDNPQGVVKKQMITKWRLEPKNQDLEKYKKGELVAPKNPIVFYIDPATPKKWVPYLIQGVNDWQKAFEKAGFKKAIYALEAPTNDPEWSLEDARHNAIVYKASNIPNASGPHIHDPRSGEILESHINWYHNVMQLIHDWYLVQVGAVDPRGRKMIFDDSLMGQLIRFVSSHEVGHTLGLMHNFGSSSTIPAENLRNKKWVEENGFCPSIMDYARFNYVAQPEDSISEKGLFPRIGVYDDWAIEWGYKIFPAIKSEEEEKSYLNKWVIEKLSSDNRLWFGSGTSIKSVEDSRTQTEDLGDNPVIATGYALKNLQRVISQVCEWSKEPGEDLEYLGRLISTIQLHYSRYFLHVAKVIGSVYYSPKTMDQEGLVYDFPSKSRQKEALQFLREQLFTTPSWMMNKKVFSLTGSGNPFSVIIAQMRVLKELLSHRTLAGLELLAQNRPAEAYPMKEYLADLKQGVWSELIGCKPIDEWRRNLQKSYIFELIRLSKPARATSSDPLSNLEVFYYNFNQRTDASSLVKQQIKDLIADISKALLIYKDQLTRAHLQDIKERLKNALNDEKDDNATDSEHQSLSNSLFGDKMFSELQNGRGDKMKCDMWTGDDFD